MTTKDGSGLKKQATQTFVEQTGQETIKVITITSLEKSPAELDKAVSDVEVEEGQLESKSRPTLFTFLSTRWPQNSPKNFLPNSFLSRWLHTSVTFAATVAGWATFFIVGAMGWPGKKSVCYSEELTSEQQDKCFCENINVGAIVAQPSNTWSNIMFAICAMVCALCSDLKLPTRWWSSNLNLMTKKKYFTLSYCFCLANISYCSAFMHAGWTHWGGLLDIIAIDIMMWHILMFSMMKFSLMWFGWTESNINFATRFHMWFMFFFSVVIIFLMFFAYSHLGKYTDILLYAVALSVPLEILVRYFYERFNKSGDERFSQAWIAWLTVVVFLLGLVFQIMSKSSQCNPYSPVQLHAVWHIFAAVAPMLFFFFTLSDKFKMQRRRNQISRLQSDAENVMLELSTEHMTAMDDPEGQDAKEGLDLDEKEGLELL